MKLKINRKKWLRNDDTDSFLLRNRDAKMCCLGFYALAKGLRRNQIRDCSSPQYLENKYIPKMKNLVRKRYDEYENNKVCSRLMTWNDSVVITEKVREEKIKYWFKKIGVEVEFIN